MEIEVPKFIKAVQGPNYSVIYIDSAGKKYLFSEGTWAWRNHNPGNVRPGDSSRHNGQIGTVIDQKGKSFAVFPDYTHGHAALNALLKIRMYQILSLDKAVATYAPSSENDTKKYQEMVRKAVQVNGRIKLSQLSAEQFLKLVAAIEQIEGSKEGKIEKIAEVKGVQRDKKGVIDGYLCPPQGWLSKGEAVNLAAQEKINAIVCTPQKGPPYLRSSPGSTPFYELPAKKAGTSCL